MENNLFPDLDYKDFDVKIENKYKINKKIRLIELFAGYSSQALSLKYLNVPFESHKIVEWEWNVINSNKEIHYPNINIDYTNNMTKEDIVDYLFSKNISNDGKSPMTREQINRKNIDDLKYVYNNIQITKNLVDITQVKGGDLGIKDTDKYEYIMVYSFPCGLAGTKIKTINNYKNIEDIEVNDYVLTHQNRYKKVIKTMNRTREKYYHIKYLGGELKITNNHPLYVYRDNKFQWIKTKDLKLTDKLTFNINLEEKEVDISNKMLWLMGRYLADGWYNKYHYNSLSFAIGEKKKEEFEKNIPKNLLDIAKIYKKNCLEYRIANKQLKELCLQLGNGSNNKEVPQWIIDLPKDKLKYFLNGYLSGDGFYRKEKNEIMFCTTSENLFYNIQDILLKVYGRVCSYYKRIDNRKKTFNDSFNGQIILTNKNQNQFRIEDKQCVIIRKIEVIEEKVKVYNIAVEEDESYTMNNVIVHNCTDLSLAGKKAGMKKGESTRSGLLWEVERILNECEELPQILLMENVTEVHGKKNLKDFNDWLTFLQRKGYKNYWKDLNSKNFKIPQNRDRTFMISVLGDYNYKFPMPLNSDLILKDMLEDEVDEKYYLSGKAIAGCLNTKLVVEKITKSDSSDYILVPENTKQGYAIARDGDGVYINRPHQKRGVVQNQMIQTLKTQQDVGVVVKANYIQYYKKGHQEQSCRIHYDYKKSPTLHTKCNDIKILNTIEVEYLNTIEVGNVKMVIYQEKYSKKGVIEINNSFFYIRKLCPIEVFRLMGVKDEDYDKITCSNAQKYKQAGNSIVVNVLMAIFKELIE